MYDWFLFLSPLAVAASSSVPLPRQHVYLTPERTNHKIFKNIDVYILLDAAVFDTGKRGMGRGGEKEMSVFTLAE